MKSLMIICAVMACALALCGATVAETIEVSQPVAMTTNGEYDRNPSVVNHAGDYWLFYTKADNIGVRSGGDVDADTYMIHYKTAATLAALPAASETKLDKVRPTDLDQRVVGAVSFKGDLYAFAGSGQSGTNRGLYYYKYSGGSWGDAVELIADVTARGGHVNVAADGTYAYIVWESSDGSSDFYRWDGTTLSAKIDISNDNMPKITIMGGTLYVVSIEDGTGNINVFESADNGDTWTGPTVAIPGAGLYDPCIFNDGTDLYVVTAPYNGGNDQQYLVQTKYSGGSWSAAKRVTNGGYGGTYWWEYWPCGIVDAGTPYVFYTTETASPTYSDGEIAMLKMDWDLANDHYGYIQTAIDAASGGDTVNVAAGTYTEAITITGKGLTITGESEAGVIVQAAASQTGAANVFTINADGKTVTLQYMTIRNGDYGIRSTAGNVNVLHCTLYRNGWDGTAYAVPPNQPNALSIYTNNCTSGGAIRIEESAVSEIAYNTIHENDRGLRFQNGNNGNIHHNNVYNNVQAGIYLASSTYTGSTGCTNTTVANNQSYGNRNNGLLSIGGKNNTFLNNQVHDNWNSGVMLWHVAENTIQNNTIDNNNLHAFNGQGNNGDAYGGVYAEGSDIAAGATFVFKLLGNTVSDSQAGAAGQKIGVRLDDSLPPEGIDVNGNTISNHDIAVHVRSQAATTTINMNNFIASTTGVQNDDASVVNAENNWWGSANGPDDPAGTLEMPENPGASVADMLNAAPVGLLGNGVSDNVDYYPWALAEVYAGTAEVVVDDDWSIKSDGELVVYNGKSYIIGTNAFDTIEEGVAAAGTIVHVEFGDYAPVSTVVIDESLSILGPQANVDPRTTAPLRKSGISPEAIVDGGGVLATIFQIEADGVEINGFEILNATGNMIQSPSGGPGLSGVAIRYNIIHHATGDKGIQLQNVSDSVVEFNHVYDIAQDAINISSGSTNCTIRSNEVNDNWSINAAIYVHSSTNTRIDENAVYDVYGNDGIILGSTSGSDAALPGGRIFRNVVHDVEQGGLGIYMSDTVVEGNFVRNCTSENGAVYIGESVDNITLTRNSIYNNGVPADGRTTYGIRVGKDSAYPTNVVAHYNTIENNEGGLIYNYSLGAPSLDAEDNWWGSANGPDDPVGTLELPENPGATVAEMLNAAPAGLLGDSVSENVDYYPWIEVPCILDGDVNCDCAVNVLDLIFVRLNLGGDPSSDPNAAKADVNRDGVVNILDMIYVRNRLRDRCPL